MKVMVKTENQSLEAIISSSFFQELGNLLNNESKPTLREIKQQISTPKIDQQLDMLIKEAIVKRQDKRYSLLLPTMQASTSMIYEMVKEKVISYLAALSLEERSIAFIHLYPKNKDYSPFLLDETVPFSYYATISNDLVTITSLATQEDAWTLPHYFQSHLKSAANSLFEPMESLIGDVDPHYYLDQVWTILDKIQQQRRRIRENIFLTSLQQFQLIDYQDRWVVTVPIQTSLTTFGLNHELEEEFSCLSFAEQCMLLGECLQYFGLSQLTVITMLK